MYLKSILQMGSLMLHFRNGATLVECLRTARSCHELVLWDGTRISHPPGREGLLEAVQEIWLEHIYTRGFYMPADNDVVVDAGANIGLFAILVARENRRCRVTALEPFAENFRYLEENVARACPANVRCRQLALGGGFGAGRMQAVGTRSLDHVLQSHSTSGDASGTNIGSAVMNNAVDTAEISVIPLAGMFDLAAAPEIDFLKVDIEGSERDVFAAATSDVLRHVKRIAMEYHDRIVPGTLPLLRRTLEPTHTVTVCPSAGEGCGILFALRRDLKN